MDDKKVLQIPVEDIIPNRFQPRLAFDDKQLNELSASIKQHGIIQPLILRSIGDKYEIIAGERRYKAACLAGLKFVPGIVTEADDQTSAELAVVENVQRKNLSAIEEAESYKKLMEKGFTQEDIAKKIGVNQSTIANKIRLLSLEEEAREALLNNRISERHARSLLQITDPIKQVTMLNKIITNRLTVKQADEEIAKLLGKTIIKNEPINNEVVNNDTNKMNIDSLLQEQNEISFISKPNVEVQKELENINPFQEKNDMEILSFDEDNKLTNPVEEIEQEELTYNSPLIEEYRQQKPPIVEETEDEKATLGDAINKVRDFSKDLEKDGFVLDVEEFDFEDMYQVVIKIQKD